VRHTLTRLGAQTRRQTGRGNRSSHEEFGARDFEWHEPEPKAKGVGGCKCHVCSFRRFKPASVQSCQHGQRTDREDRIVVRERRRGILRQTARHQGASCFCVDLMCTVIARLLSSSASADVASASIRRVIGLWEEGEEGGFIHNQQVTEGR
jgi:hypothetical protein